MLKAIIEIGSNSVRYLLGKDNGTSLEILSEKRIATRLRDSVGHTGLIQDKNLNESITVVQTLLTEAKKHNPATISIIATDVLRRANNKQEVKKIFEENIGREIDILSPNQEARLAFLGATINMSDTSDFLVIDIGGGSTEIIHGTKTNIYASSSLGIGAISLSESFLAAQPAGENDLQLLNSYIQKQISKLLKPENDFTMIGIGGAVTTAACALMQKNYNAKTVNDFIITKSKLTALIAAVSKMNTSEIATLPGIEEKKADIILAGLYVIENLMTHFNTEKLYTKTTGVIHGCLTNDTTRR